MSKYLGESFTDCDGDQWEIWPDRGSHTSKTGGLYRVFKRWGRWRFMDRHQDTCRIEDAPKYARMVVTEIERRWPGVEQKALPASTSIALMGDEDLVRALKEAHRNVRLWSTAAVVSSVLAAINGLIILCL